MNPRYENFTFLKTPVLFKDLFKDTDIEYVQVHDATPIFEDQIVGFCGVFSWKNNKIEPLDGDSYSDNMPVLGYNWFINNFGIKCLDILVSEW